MIVLGRVSEFFRNHSILIKEFVQRVQIIQQTHLLMSIHFQQNSVVKNFALRNQLTGKTDYHVFQLFLYPNSSTVNIAPALHFISKQGKRMANVGVPLQNSLIFFMDFDKKIDVYLGSFPQQNLSIPIENIQSETIFLRFKQIDSSQSSSQHTIPKKKVKERTINQAIEGVKQWIELYNAVNEQGHKIYTLQSAANKVGISKKTLDDYYKHIRMGEENHFDFQKNKQQKIGVLRNFIRARNLTCPQKRVDPETFWALDPKQSG